MIKRKLVLAIVGLTLCTLGACSSSFGGGDPPPSQVKVVVPPGSTASQN